MAAPKRRTAKKDAQRKPKSQKGTQKRPADKSKTIGVKRGPGGQFLKGSKGIGGRKPGSLDGVVACKRFLAGQLAEMSAPGADFERMIRRRRDQGPDGIEWLWEHVFADFVRKIPDTAGQPVTVYNVSIGADRTFPKGMDRPAMVDQPSKTAGD